ncbi:hypothetical protein C8046_14970 [Serinibacter arcticus]|uniref:Nitroreductase domain-containing protein n=1 Tax=Serinibacter arcticus TaxID=1655435 RepID=A0A2U1ZXN8_9MICO|nr:hypothetical protein [Serinibacter arcticus]PWD51755.1 hypothetical protein C8046_14970 [Serinibacter arcticus]
MEQPWRDVLEEARRYPSPHNSQPIKVRVTGERTADVFYDLDLGLPAESFGIPFAHVCAGAFLHSLAVVAAGHGWSVEEDLRLTPMDFDGEDRQHLVGSVRLVPRESDGEARADHEAYLRRRTSRRPYDGRVVPADVLDGVASLAREAGHELGVTADPEDVRDLVRINQATLFDDLRNDAVHTEILHWLRFSKDEAAEKADGLSAETMLMPGGVLRFAMSHRGLWEAPVIGRLIKFVYLRTMRGVPQLAWLTGPFADERDHLEAGRTFMRAWLHLERNGVVLHPLGTVITNPRSHAALVERLGIDETDGRMTWMLVRLGYSERPPLAHRRDVDSLVLP